MLNSVSSKTYTAKNIFPKKPPAKKTWNWKKIVAFIAGWAIIIGIITLIFIQFDFKNALEIIYYQLKWWAILIIIFYPFITALIYAGLQRITFQSLFPSIKWPLFRLFPMFLFWNFLSVVTPFGAGAEANKAYYFAARNYKLKNVLPCLLTFNLTFSLVNCTTLLFTFIFILASPMIHIFYPSNEKPGIGLIVIAFTVISVVFQILWMSSLILMGFNSRVQAWIIHFAIKIMVFFRIKSAQSHRLLEHKMKHEANFMKTHLRSLFHKKLLLIILVIGFGGIIIYKGTLVYLLFMGLSYPNIPFFPTLITSIFAEGSNAIIPIPSGAISFDLTFVYLISNLLTNYGLNAAQSKSVALATLILLRTAITILPIAYGFFSYLIYLPISYWRRKNTLIPKVKHTKQFTFPSLKTLEIKPLKPPKKPLRH